MHESSKHATSPHVPVEEVYELRPGLGSRVTALLNGMCCTVVQMTAEKNFFSRAQGGMSGRNLLHDVGTIPFFVDHATDTIDLTAHARKALEQVALRLLGQAHCMWNFVTPSSHSGCPHDATHLRIKPETYPTGV